MLKNVNKSVKKEAEKEIRVGDIVKTKRGYYGRVVNITKLAALLDVGFAYLIREPLDTLEKVDE